MCPILAWRSIADCAYYECGQVSILISQSCYGNIVILHVVLIFIDHILYRHSGKINKLAEIQGSTLPVDIVDSLNSSVLVTGAILVGTGNCSIGNDIISVNASIQIPPIGRFDKNKKEPHQIICCISCRSS